MKKILIKILLTITLSITSVIQAESINSIEILGLNTISRGTVLSYLPVEVGDDYSKRTSVQIIRALYETNFFKDIEVSQSNQVLKIKLQENPYIKYVELLNISDKVIKEESIKQILKSVGLSQGKIFNKRQLNKLISQLEASYISKGYYGIKITKTVEIDTQNRVGIELNVTEGEVARISDMKIIGTKVHDEDELLDLFEIGKSDFLILNYFTKRDHYSKIALDAGIEAIKSLYSNAGYLDFQVSKIDTTLSEDKKNISINIQINEGAQYKVGSIKFSGNLLNYSIDDLNDLLTISKGDVFERTKVIESIRAITDLFTDKGYAFAEVNVVTKEDLKAHTIDLDFNTSLNKRVYINRITIVGNTRTQDEVIRREIDIAEGGSYSNKDLQESIRKIKRLGFFSDVKMEAVRVKNFSDKINLNFQVEETKTGNITLGLSHSNSSGASFEFGIDERNFLGTGVTLNAKLSNSTAVKEINFFLEDPYFTDSNHSINYGVFSKKSDGMELDLSEYKIDMQGFSIGYGIPLSESTRINSSFKYSMNDISCYGDFITLEESQCDKKGDEAKLHIDWSGNTLNNYQFPTDGHSNSINLNIALPIADYRYYKFDINHKSYYPFSDDLTFKINGKLGFAKGYNNQELPFFKRYYGGGSSSVRGFEFNSLGPKYDESDPDSKAKGGELSILSGVSIISPLKFISKSENMRMSAFVDVGGIYSKVSDINLGDLRMSTGIAISWLTPIGPLGIYVAKPILKKDLDKTKTVEFTLGTTF